MTNEALKYVMKSMDSLQSQLSRRSNDDRILFDSLEFQSSENPITTGQSLARATALLKGDLACRIEAPEDIENNPNAFIEITPAQLGAPMPGVPTVNSVFLRKLAKETQFLIDRLNEVRR